MTSDCVGDFGMMVEDFDVKMFTAEQIEALKALAGKDVSTYTEVDCVYLVVLPVGEGSAEMTLCAAVFFDGEMTILFCNICHSRATSIVDCEKVFLKEAIEGLRLNGSATQHSPIVLIVESTGPQGSWIEEHLSSGADPKFEGILLMNECADGKAGVPCNPKTVHLAHLSLRRFIESKKLFFAPECPAKKKLLKGLSEFKFVPVISMPGRFHGKTDDGTAEEFAIAAQMLPFWRGKFLSSEKPSYVEFRKQHEIYQTFY